MRKFVLCQGNMSFLFLIIITLHCISGSGQRLSEKIFFTEDNVLIHPTFIDEDSNQDSNQVRDQVIDRIIETLQFCIDPKTKGEMLKNLKLTNKSTNFKTNILPAIESGLLEMTLPDKPTSKNQKYITTEKGKKIINS